MSNHQDGLNGATVDPSKPKPLRITICGCGIGGLAAAIFLRRGGHDVTLLEQWDGVNESGAAIILPPTANGLFRRVGYFAENFGANDYSFMTVYNPDGTHVETRDMSGPKKMWKHPYLIMHRANLHKSLRDLATSDEGEGNPATIKFASKVAEVDAENATVTLENGERVIGDLVVGADGLSSICRSYVSEGDKIKPMPNGKSAFRFLLPRSIAQANERTKKFSSENGQFIGWYGEDRTIVMYPCSNDKLLNFVCIHPDSETDAAKPIEDWNAGGNKRTLCKCFNTWDRDIQTLLSMVESNSLKLWKLMDMEKLPTWVNGRLALIGDAARPILPYYSQGGAQAVEDAASLSIVLPLGTRKEEIPERLKLYESCRYERGHKIQSFVRKVGQDNNGPSEKEMMMFMRYVLGHDEWVESTKKFNEWKEAKQSRV